MLTFNIDCLKVSQDTFLNPFVYRIQAIDLEKNSFDISIYAEENEGYFVFFKRKESSEFKELEEFNCLFNSFAFDVKIERYTPFFEPKKEFNLVIKQKDSEGERIYRIPVILENRLHTKIDKYLIENTFSGKKLFFKVVPGSKIKLKVSALFSSSFSTGILSFQQINISGFTVRTDDVEFELQEGFGEKEIELEIDKGGRYLAVFGQEHCLGASILSVEYLEIGKHLACDLITSWLPRYFMNHEYQRFISLLTLNLNDILYFLNELFSFYKLENFPYYLVSVVSNLLDFYIPSDATKARKLIPLLFLNSHIAGTQKQIELLMDLFFEGVNYSLEASDNEVYIYVDDNFEENRDALIYGILRKFGAAHLRYNFIFTQASFIIGVSDYLEVYTFLR